MRGLTSDTERLEGINKQRTDVPGVADLVGTAAGIGSAPGIVALIEPEGHISNVKIETQIVVNLELVGKAYFKGIILLRHIDVIAAHIGSTVRIIGRHPRTRAIMQPAQNTGIVGAAEEAHVQGVADIFKEAHILETCAEAPRTRKVVVDGAVAFQTVFIDARIGLRKTGNTVVVADGRQALRTVTKVVVVAGTVPAVDAGRSPVRFVFQQQRCQPAATVKRRIVIPARTCA